MGTLDELFEVLTLKQTGKVQPDMPVVLFGKKFWKDIINWDAICDYGVISQVRRDASPPSLPPPLPPSVWAFISSSVSPHLTFYFKSNDKMPGLVLFIYFPPFFWTSVFVDSQAGTAAEP